jgi:hypothetical protein
MKKVLIIGSIILFGLGLLSSCKSADCPAYTKADTDLTVEVTKA